MSSFSAAVKSADVDSPESAGSRTQAERHTMITFCGTTKRKSQRLGC
jgi:hypothetical protein